MSNRNAEFLTKLARLLDEYDVMIGWQCGSGSDMHGVYGEEMRICHNVTNEILANVEGCSISARDLRLVVTGGNQP